MLNVHLTSRGRLRLAGIAIGVTVAMLATACSGSSSTRGASGSLGDPTKLAALPASTAAQGDRAPVYIGATITPDSGISTSVSPTISVPGETGNWTFVVKDLSDTTGGFSRSYSVTGSSVRVPVGAGLRNGTAYQWTATSPEHPGRTLGGSFMVDVQRLGVQQVDSFQGAIVGLSSGEGAVSWSSHEMVSASGSVGFGLRFAASNAAQAGVPAGWNLGASSASEYDSLLVGTDGTVGIVATNGAVSHYRLRGAAYEPVRLSGVVQVTGAAPVLAANADGTWSVTTKDRTIVFSAADATTGVADLLSVSSGGVPTLTQTSSDGLLRTIGDPVSKRSVSFNYGGGDCPSLAPGFVAAPKGMICSVKFWDGSQSAISYVTLPDGSVSIGRITDRPEAGGDGAQVTDFAYDAVGRVARVRSPLVAAAAAAGIIDAGDAQFWTDIQHDDAGRVASVTSPAPSAGADRKIHTYQYSLRVTSVVDSTFGAIARLEFQPSTFLSTASTDAAGLTATAEYAPGTSNVTRSVSRNGNVTLTSYKEGLVDTITGPTEGSFATDATTTKYSYDQSYASDGTADSTTTHGLDVTYWPNAGFEGTDTTDEVGPRIGGALAPSLVENWTEAPVGSGAWSARMSGVLRVNTEGTYTITADGEAKVWVETLSCANGGCKDLPLTAGIHQIRVDVSSPEAQGSMAVRWSGPDTGGAMVAIPTSALEPRYGRVTTTRANDTTAAGVGTETTTHNRYDQPSTGLLTSRWTQAGLSSSLTYEDRGGSSGAWGRQLSSTLPGGNTTTMSYWGDTESAKSSCPGAKSANQGGQQKVLVAPGADGTASGPSTTTWFDDAGRVVARSVANGGTVCYVFDKGGRISESREVGGSQPMWSTVEFGTGGNPLVNTTTTHEGSTTTTATSEVDLLGRTVRSVDRYGIVSTTIYDRSTGNVASVTVTPPGSAPIVTSSTYDAQGRLVATALDGKPLATLVYASDGTVDRITYGNGTTAIHHVNANNRTDRIDWSNASGATWSTSLDLDPGGRILGATNSVGATSVNWTYSYDGARRLASAALTGAMAEASTWNWTYDANSNRTGQTITSAKGTRTSTYAYNGADQLVSSADPATEGGIEYDVRGNATRVGPDTFAYDAFDRVLAASDGSTEVEYVRGLGGSVITRSTTDAKGTSLVRPASGGLLLDDGGRPMSQTIGLPGDVSLTRWFGSTTPTQWVVSDLQGNRFVTLDDAGAIVGSPQVFDPFGVRLSAEATPPPGAPPAEWQASSGASSYSLRTPIVEMGLRVYVPALGRFIQHDPVMGGSANGYDYADQDPVNHADPTGESILDWIGFGVLLVAAVAVSVATAGAAGPVLGGAMWGAVAGMALYGVIEGAHEIATGADDFDWTSMAIYAGVGALLGGGAGAFGGGGVAIEVEAGGEMSVGLDVAAAVPEEAAASAQVAQVQQVRTAIFEIDDMAFEPTAWEHQPITKHLTRGDGGRIFDNPSWRDLQLSKQIKGMQTTRLEKAAQIAQANSDRAMAQQASQRWMAEVVADVP